MMQTLRLLDRTMLAAVISLGVLGLFTLYAAVSAGDLGLWYRQLIYWFFGLIVFFGLCLLPTRFVALASWPIYLVALILLALVPLFGDVHMGARRWLDFGPFLLQPSETMKWALMMLMAHWFASREAADIKSVGVSLLLAGVPAALIVIQPDLGTTLVLLSAATVMIMASGLKWRWFILGGIAAISSLPLLWMKMHAYQKSRVLSFLDPQSDPLGAGYHVIQSGIAIGSGGLLGKGYLQGSQSRLHFLPEQHTDFIFAVLAEEGGLIASALLLFLYAILIFQILRTASIAHTRFGSLICIGVASIFTLYIVVNIGMVTGMLPVVGVPLPFISYGGSALVTMLAAIGLVMRISIESKPRTPWQRPGSPFA